MIKTIIAGLNYNQVSLQCQINLFSSNKIKPTLEFPTYQTGKKFNHSHFEGPPLSLPEGCKEIPREALRWSGIWGGIFILGQHGGTGVLRSLWSLRQHGPGWPGRPQPHLKPELSWGCNASSNVSTFPEIQKDSEPFLRYSSKLELTPAYGLIVCFFSKLGKVFLHSPVPSCPGISLSSLPSGVPRIISSLKLGKKPGKKN